MQIQQQNRFSARFIVLYSTLLFGYVFARALLLFVTYDEAWSIETYVGGSFWNIVTYEPCDSNNHLLNSLFIKLLYLVLPNTLFVARLPSLIAFLIFLQASKKLSQQFSKTKSALVFFVLLSNPFMLDFFSLARGYSLSLAGMMFALYYLQCYLQTKETKKAFYGSIAAGIACLAVLSFLNFFAAYMALVLWQHLKNQGLFHRSTLLLLVAPMTLILLLSYPLYKLTRYDNLYYGGTESIYKDSYLSLFRYSSYHMFEQAWMIYLAPALLVLLLLGFLFKFFNLENKIHQTWPLVLLIVAVLVNLLQVKFLKGYYLIDRTALFYYPLLVLLPVSTKKYARMYQSLPSAIVALLIVINLFSAVNLTHTLVWFFDAETKTTLQKLEQLGIEKQQVLPLGCSWPLHKSMEYYLKGGNFPHLKQDWNPRYYLYLDSNLDRIDYYPEKEEIRTNNKDTLFYSPLTKVVVYEKK